MSDAAFSYDGFVRRGAKDEAVVRPLAERLRPDWLPGWLHEREVKPRDSIPAKTVEGLQHSRVLVPCISGNAFCSDCEQSGAGTFQFRDPLNNERRFVPLRIDDAPIKASLAQFFYISWLVANREGRS
jgi:hypothetical protein